MSYVDGFITRVPTRRKTEYIEVAKQSAAIFKEHGALQVAECWENEVDDDSLNPFRGAMEVATDESVCFSWILWESKASRDAGMEKIRVEPRMQADVFPMPFDFERMVYGGFEMVASS